MGWFVFQAETERFDSRCYTGKNLLGKYTATRSQLWGRIFLRSPSLHREVLGMVEVCWTPGCSPCIPHQFQSNRRTSTVLWAVGVGSSPANFCLCLQARFTAECQFRERFQENSYNTYASAVHRGQRSGRQWYVALNKRGKAKRGCSPRARPQHVSTHFLPRFRQPPPSQLAFTVARPEKKPPPPPPPPPKKMATSRHSPGPGRYRLKFRFG